MTTIVQKLNGINATNWMAQAAHKYVGRSVRILNGSNAGHHWNNSGFGNPYRFNDGESDAEKRIKMLCYVIHLKRQLNASKIVADTFKQMVSVSERRQLVLGCWCLDWNGIGPQVPLCHACYLARIVDLLTTMPAVSVDRKGWLSPVAEDELHDVCADENLCVIRRAW